MTPEGEALLLEGARQLGLDVSERLAAFRTFSDLLGQAAATTNLTALKGERDIVLKHFVDSLSCGLTGDLTGRLRVIDLGTGAGFPGLPLAIVHADLDLTLLDATRRKVAFVEQVIGALDLPNALALAGRAEALGRQAWAREQYDRVVVRAVSRLPVLIELALPLLRVGGRLLAQKGPLEAQELEAGEKAAAEVGGLIREVRAFALPISQDPRTLVVIEKTAPTPSRYPRREGVPAKHPLF